MAHKELRPLKVLCNFLSWIIRRLNYYHTYFCTTCFSFSTVPVSTGILLPMTCSFFVINLWLFVPLFFFFSNYIFLMMYWDIYVFVTRYIFAFWFYDYLFLFLYYLNWDLFHWNLYFLRIVSSYTYYLVCLACLVKLYSCNIQYSFDFYYVIIIAINIICVFGFVWWLYSFFVLWI